MVKVCASLVIIAASIAMELVRLPAHLVPILRPHTASRTDYLLVCALMDSLTMESRFAHLVITHVARALALAKKLALFAPEALAIE